jgi:hypothetical protein
MRPGVKVALHALLAWPTYVAYPASIGVGGVIMSDDLVHAFLAKPFQFLQTTYMALLRPAQLARTRIVLHNRMSLRRAVGYWFTALTVVVALGALTDLLIGQEMLAAAAKFGVGTAAKVIAAVRSSTILSQGANTLLFAVFSLAWYLVLRIFISRNALSLTSFVHCAAYPAGAILVIVAALTLLSNLGAAIHMDPFALVPTPDLCRDCTGLSVEMYTALLIVRLFFRPFVFYAIAYGIAWLAIASIIKQAAGVSRRTTLGALFLLVVPTIVIAVGGLIYYAAHV